MILYKSCSELQTYFCLLVSESNINSTEVVIKSKVQETHGLLFQICLNLRLCFINTEHSMTLLEILWCHKTSFGKELKVKEVPRIPSTKLLAKSYDSHLKLFPQFAAEYSPYPALAAIVYCVALA